MTLFVCFSLTMSVVLCGVNAFAQDDPVASTPADQQRIAGTWIIIRVTLGGEEFDLRAPGNLMATASFDEDQCRLDLGDRKLTWRGKFASRKDGKTSERWWGELQGTLEGVAACNGWYLYQPPSGKQGMEMLALNLNDGTAERPLRKFDPHPMQIVMARSDESRSLDKLALEALEVSVADRLGPDLAKLQGRWKLETVDGDPVAQEVIHEIRDDRFVRRLNFTDGSGGITLEAKLSINRDADPNELDLQYPNFGTQRGIYQCENDRLTICVNGFNKPRPKGFSDGSREDIEVLVYRRLK